MVFDIIVAFNIILTTHLIIRIIVSKVIGLQRFMRWGVLMH